ncbi:MAG: IS607 family transposase [Chloroflexi bacterium HGW-Chloroflexi-10]|nr:MAG: IS607 family transposase [Chloroflexi bacterium HGW-Chloroflexi-10]
MEKMISIGEASKILGVTPKTIRIWESQGKIKAERTPNGHRRYNRDEIVRLSSFNGKIRKDDELAKKRTIAYARVSSHDQKEDLKQQVQLLETFCVANGWTSTIIQDLGSGLNYDKRGLKNLIKEICAGNVDRLVLTHKDRLLRFGSEIVFSLCENYGTEVVILNKGETPATFEEELVSDILDMITVFSARLYGTRSHKNKIVIKKLKDAAEAISS